ncbi:MAG: gp36 [uncultured marine phage]|uniref:peptidyl-tRNA hydrolase n=1 Tax=uncultured marine phage TaxID=707152 RepID=A0A8D9CB19_9VIRU|nr:MAG: gp36 [uncultured marine phage]
MEREVRQTIVIRKDLGMRRGKEIAQGAHSSGAFLARRLRDHGEVKMEDLSIEKQMWLQEKFTKICLIINHTRDKQGNITEHAEDKMKKLFDDTSKAGLEVHIITDSGKTEFKGVPTITALCIGPNYKDDIDPFTKDLKLY